MGPIEALKRLKKNLEHQNKSVKKEKDKNS